ncbi:MAG: sulfate ABC transporter permease subunit CysW [Candidatus Reconcilbacillus cellulovorans]|uniref:Sulfate ABC transporter permease subunit CysW n=1 Tax=Candidatus Reconcilbacillus cellulovorans TaxID=1906605 RepID=A0A2A6E193_9BACL|nr:MAG: sulfate ABC transporter permease subunit CysW [Candidatus Reconcilbacillus cellulovorans]
MQEPRWFRAVLGVVTALFVAVVLVLPLATVFEQAFRKGVGVYLDALTEPDAVAAIRLTLVTAAIVLPFQLAFGLAASWALTRFRFPGKRLLVSMIDLPFAVSPVIAGLVFVLLFGSRGWFGPWLEQHDIRIVFAMPGIVLATMFVTVPFVARELVPVMQSLGTGEEEAAATLGAKGWTLFWRITLPNIRWALFYGAVLCAARAMGEFGAVSVVSGHIRGETNTIPLHVEILYNDYDFTASFAVASLLTLIGLATMAVKRMMEWGEARYAGRGEPSSEVVR